MLAQARVKTITVHTRKEVIAIFQQLKTKINSAFELQSHLALRSLQTVIRSIYYLAPLPHFLTEINSVGTLPVTGFLENLLVKFRMSKVAQDMAFQDWLSALLYQFQKFVNGFSLKQVKGMKEVDMSLKEYQWGKQQIQEFIGQGLEQSANSNDAGLFSVIIILFRNFLVFSESSIADDNRADWRQSIKYLTKGCWMLNSITREQTGISINYYLCLKYQSLCFIAIEHGIIKYLLQTLNSRYMFQSFGKRIIQFLRLLMFNATTQQAKEINVVHFEEVLSKFIIKYNKSSLTNEVRTLMELLDKKTETSHQPRLDRLYNLFEIGRETDEQQIFNQLAIISLYAQNGKTAQLILKDHLKFLNFMITTPNQILVKMLAELLSVGFSNGRLGKSVGEVIISTINRVVSDGEMKDRLNICRKRILIDFVRTLKQLLDNREHYEELSIKITKLGLDRKLWAFSDCTNYQFQKQMISLSDRIGHQPSPDNQKSIFYRLQDDFIEKSKVNFNKPTLESCEQIVLLNELYNKCHHISEDLSIHPDLSPTLSSYIRPSSIANPNLLHSLEIQDRQRLRKKINLAVCKFLQKILKMPSGIQKVRLIELSASNDELEEVGPIVHKILAVQQPVANGQSSKGQLGKSSAKIKEQVKNYFDGEVAQTHFLIELSQPQFQIVLSQMQAYESEAHLVRFLRLLIQICQRELLCLEVFLKFGGNLSAMYGYLLSNASENNRESIILLDTLLVRFIKLHISLFFNDQYMQVNFWLEIAATIDSNFEAFINRKRIILLELIFQYLDLNKLLEPQSIIKMMSKPQRIDFLKAETLQNKGQTLGYCLGIMLHQLHTQMQSIAFHHKQNVLRQLTEGSDLVSIPKFVSLYLLSCLPKAFSDFHLQEWVKSVVELLDGELKRVQGITSQAREASLQLRRIYQFVNILSSLNQRKELTVEKPLLLGQQDTILKCLKHLLYYIDMFQGEQFKKYYLGQIITTVMTTLVNLYRNNFRLIEVKGGDLIECFDSLLSINTQGIKDSVCQIMRVLLLKKDVRMMNCQTLITCKEYRDSLSHFSQQQIYYCERIQSILYEGGDLEDEFSKYFTNTYNNNLQANPKSEVIQIPTTSAYLIADEDENRPPTDDPHLAKRGSIDLEEPLFLQFASENSIPSQPQIDSSQCMPAKQNQQNEEVIVKSLRQISSTPSCERLSNRQGQFDKSTQIIQILDTVWTEQQIMDSIQAYLENPQSVQIKPIINHLLPIPSKKYANLLLQLFLKTNINFSPQKDSTADITLRDIHLKIVANIPVEFCQPNDSFYEVLASGIEGASLGLKFKNVGLRGLEIYCKRFMNSLSLPDISFYAGLLADKRSFEELKFLKNSKIYDVVNQKLPYFIKSNESLTPICNLITQTCRYPPLCNSYQVVPYYCNHLVSQIISQENRLPILNTIKTLSKSSEKHRRQIQNSQFLGELVELLQKSDSSQQGLLLQLLLMGGEENIQISQLYQKLSLEETLLNILRNYIQSSHYQYQTFLYSLRILQMLASLPQSAVRILKGGIMSLCKPISQSAINAGNFDIVGATINILRNLLQEMELNLSRVISDLEKEGLLSYLLYTGDCLFRCHQIESYLGILAKLITNSTINKKLLEKVDSVLRILNELARNQLTSQFLLEQWMKVVFLLVESNRYSLLPQILTSNIFFSCASSLRPFHSLSDNIFNMNSRMMREIHVKVDLKGLLSIHGYADFLVEALRMINLSLDQYLNILNTLSQLFKNRYFSSKLSTQLFAVVMMKLQNHWKDEVAISSITLLKSIKRNVEVTAEFGSIMLDFCGKFLTQSSKISSYEYYSISREVICLLSYFLVFNQQIRGLFRSRIMLDIMRNWIRVAKALQYVDMPQSFKLFFYSVYSQQSLYIDLCDVGSKKIAEAEAGFERGWRCNLYRSNGTYKEAVLKMDKAKVEIVAFKFPEGVVKDKYRLSLKDLLVIERYHSDKDVLFGESVFTKGVNPFQHKVNPQHCLTLLSLSGQKDEVRQISIQMEKKLDVDILFSFTKLLVSRAAESQIEEESKVWQLVNKKPQ